MSGLQWEILLIYLDDIIVFGKTVPEMIERLRVVFSRLRQAGLKLKPSKCHLFKESVTYLGHIVTTEGVATDPKKIQTIRDWPVPKSVKDVRSFLGLASYYRKFIQGFAEIASPLHALTEKSREFEWSELCQSAFEELKSRLQTSPILSYPMPEGDFILDTDASGDGIGAVLSQVQEGEERVLAYASRKLSRPERNYCVTRRELLAVVVYLKYFKQYIYGRKVTVRTDHSALRWILNFKNPEGQMARWLEVISEYDIEIQHRAGKKHGNADGLSRRPCKQCGREELVEKGETNGTSEETLEGTSEKMSEMEDKPEGKQLVRGIAAQPGIPVEALRKAQVEDETISWVLKAKEEGKDRPEWKEISHLTAAHKTYWSYWNQLCVRDELVHKRWESDNGKVVRWLLVVPQSMRKEILREVHGGQLSGHLGMTKTLAKMKFRYFWSGMSGDVRSFIRSCDLCARRKSPAKKSVAPLQQYRVGVPMERVAIDLLGPLPKTESGNQWILVIGDYCTKWMEAFPLPDAKASTVARKLVQEFVCRYGVPQELHSDQGTNFESEVFKEMCQILGVTKTRTTAYNPKSDGMVERFNKTLVNMVAALISPHGKQKDWDKFLPYATFAYRCTPQDSTGESPNMMMLGREVSIPVDLATGCPETEVETNTDFAEELRSNLQSAHQRARECLGKRAQRQKRNYDRRATEKGLKEGGFAWLHNPARKKQMSPKLQLRWEGPWLVVKKLSDVTFRIQLRRNGRLKVVHADRLKPYRGEKLVPWKFSPEEGVEENPQVEPVKDAVSERETPKYEEDDAVSESEMPKMNSEENGVVSEPENRRYPRRSHRLPVRYR